MNLLAILAVFTLATAHTSAGSEVVTFQGVGTWQVYRPKESAQTHRIWFSVEACLTDACRWRIEYGYDQPYIDKFVCGTDGSNITTVAYYKPEFTNDTSYAIVEKAAIPRGDECLPLSAMWIAFLAPEHLDKSPTNRITPPYFKDGNANMSGASEPVEFEVTRVDGGSGCVSRMVFFHDGRALDRKGRWVEAPVPFDNGFTNAVFEATKLAPVESTGGRYPEEFTLDYYYLFPDSNARRWERHRSQGCRLWVTNVVRTNLVGALLPSATEAMDVLDRRFLSRGRPLMNVAYKTDRHLTDAEVTRLDAFALAVEKERAIRTTGFGADDVSDAAESRRQTLVFLLLLPTVFTVAFVVSQLKFKNPNTKGAVI